LTRLTRLTWLTGVQLGGLSGAERPLGRQRSDRRHGGQRESQPVSNTRKLMQPSVRSVRKLSAAHDFSHQEAENASDDPLAHERQKRVRRASEGRQKQHGSVRTSLRWEACQPTAGARQTRPETTVGIRHARAGAA
jgi:hypothetical protein